MSSAADRAEDIHIRHKMADYVCRISYNESREDFHFVSVRYADTSISKPVANGFDLYMRILKEPNLRANLHEAFGIATATRLTDMREEGLRQRASSVGLNAGIAAFVLLGIAIYFVFRLLARRIGNDWAEVVTFVPAFSAFIVVMPVQHIVRSWYLRRHCDQNGHMFETWNDRTGRQITMCKRCGLRTTNT
jgi:hypothetical protein